VFLYWSASIFIYGGELNAALRGRTQNGSPTLEGTAQADEPAA